MILLEKSMKKPREIMPPGYVLHIIDPKSGGMTDQVFDVYVDREKAAEMYLRLNPGKPIWKTNERIKR